MHIHPSAFAIASAITVALFSACGPSSQSSQPTAEMRAPQNAGPVRIGRVSHNESVEEMTRFAARVLASAFEMTPTAAPGVVTTEWKSLDPGRWPGLEIRVAVEIAGDEVIVRFQCQRDGRSCTGAIPDALRLGEQAQAIANEIVAASRPQDAEEILVRMRAFSDQLCACRDQGCIEDVEADMMRWAMANMDEMKGLKPSRAQDDEADRIQDVMEACKQRHEPAPSQGSGSRAPQVSTGSPECDAYLATFDELAATCRDKLGPALDAMKQSRDAQAAAFAEWARLDDASRRATIAAAKVGCSAATDALQQSAEAMGCRLQSYQPGTLRPTR